MEQHLVVRTPRIPDVYLLAQALRLMPDSQKFMNDFQTAINPLVAQELRFFGGSLNRPDDFNKAELRVLKMINLGLEKAANVKGRAGGLYDFNLALNILLQAPPPKLYALGKGLFSQDQKIASDTLKEVEIEIDGLWYCLISSDELQALRSVVDIDRATVTLEEHSKTMSTITSVIKKMNIVPYLPINPQVLKFHPHWGSSVKGFYPMAGGVINCFLLSLIIACAFRSEDEMYGDRRHIKNVKQFAKIAAESRLKGDHEMARIFADSASTTSRFVDMDRNERYNGIEARVKQEFFLADVLAVSLEEVNSFADTCFFEQDNFRQHLKSINESFFRYFHEAKESLHLPDVARFNDIINDSLKTALDQAYKETKQFYLGLDDPEASKEKIICYWDLRVSLDRDFNLERTRSQLMATQSLNQVDAKKLATASMEVIIKSTVLFSFWSEQDQAALIDGLNPTVRLREDKSARNLVKLLYNLSSADASGWSEELVVEINRCQPPIEGESGVVLVASTIDWVGRLLAKIAWDLIHPSIVQELWEYGSDRIRDGIFEGREKIKVTLPALKNLYMREHVDVRLFAWALDLLANSDIIKPNKKAWNNLFDYTSYSVHQTILRSKMREVLGN
jgi:hypothetical protein